MSPTTDRLAGDSTTEQALTGAVTRQVPDPATEAPRPRRVARAIAPGGPDSAAPPAESGGKTPAGASGHDSPPAGSRGLSGAEWRAAAKAAQSKGRRRQPARTAAAKPAPPPPVTGGAALTATANCIGRCDWTAGPGDPAEVDKAAEKHVKAGHPTNTVTEVAS